MWKIEASFDDCDDKLVDVADNSFWQGLVIAASPAFLVLVLVLSVVVSEYPEVVVSVKVLLLSPCRGWDIFLRVVKDWLEVVEKIKS